MIDPITIPIFATAVDWLFGEGSKILQECRERRKAEQAIKEEDSEASPPASMLNDKSMIRSKEDALQQQASRVIWDDSEAKVNHLVSLLKIYTKSYYLAKEAYAKWGSALVPPIIVHNLTEAEDNIAITTKELQTLLGKVYGKTLHIPQGE